MDIEKSIYMSLVPEYLRSNKDFLVFLQLAVSEFDICLDNIKNFTDLINPDKVPSEFIEALGAFVGYNLVVDADDDFNREILMRVQSIYEQRGTDKAIIMAATHGSNDGWVGGDIFIPNYEITKDSAELILAKDCVFRHNKSKFSGGDVFTDGGTYRAGVIVISLPFIDTNIREAIDKVIPAGVKYKFTINSTFLPNDSDELGEFGELSFGKGNRVVPLNDAEKESEQSATNTILDINIPLNNSPFDSLIFDVGHNGKKKRSGRMVIQSELVSENSIGVSTLPISFLKEGFVENPNNKPEKDIYIIAPTGEKLDVKEKIGSKHITRDIESVGEEIEFKQDVRLSAKRNTYSAYRSGMKQEDIVFKSYLGLTDTENDYLLTIQNDEIVLDKITDALLNDIGLYLDDANNITNDSTTYLGEETESKDDDISIALKDVSLYIKDIAVSDINYNYIYFRDLYNYDCYRLYVNNDAIALEKVDNTTNTINDKIYISDSINNNYYAIEVFNNTLRKRKVKKRITGMGKMSGIMTNDVDAYAGIYEITPQDCLYDISNINKLRPNDLRNPFVTFGIDS